MPDLEFRAHCAEGHPRKTFTDRGEWSAHFKRVEHTRRNFPTKFSAKPSRRPAPMRPLDAVEREWLGRAVALDVTVYVGDVLPAAGHVWALAPNSRAWVQPCRPWTERESAQSVERSSGLYSVPLDRLRKALE